MAFTRDWQEALPDDNSNANEIDNFIKNLRVDCSDRVKDMIYGFTAGENDGVQGLKKATFKQRSSAPSTPAADIIEVYAFDDGSNCGMSAIQENGYTKQWLKKSGTSLILNCEAGDYAANSVDQDDIQLANNAYMTALDAAGTGTVDLIKAGSNDLPTLPDSSEMASNAAPTEDEGISNKKYVDDQVAAKYWPALLSKDSENNTFLKAHAYLAAQNGMVHAHADLDNGETLIGYTGATNDPAGAGVIMGYQERVTSGSPEYRSVSFAVRKDKYWEITCSGTPVIYWQPMSDAGGSPVDQD
jgi:hypothetical protein